MRLTSLATFVLLLGLTAACSAAGATDEAAAPAAAEPRTLDAQAATDLITDRNDVVVVDVRTPGEFDQGHLQGAELIDIQSPDFADRIAELDPEVTTVVYCRTGNRSAQAVQRMADQGFTDLYDAGGFDDLARAGAPVNG